MLVHNGLDDVRPREPHWSAAFAVGGRRWLGGLAGGDPRVAEHIRPLAGSPGADPEATYVLNPPQSLYRRIWNALVQGEHR
jgi:hypothetical protein